jgi:hypothetical protein
MKLGIPKDAIKQKMSLIGADPRVLDYPETAPYVSVLHYISNPQLKYIAINNVSSNSLSISGIPPPPPPPPPTMFSKTGNDSNIRVGLLNEISQGGFKLKKIDPKEKLISKLSTSIPGGIKVPSLGDIQNALARLKKVEIDSSEI